MKKYSATVLLPGTIILLLISTSIAPASATDKSQRSQLENALQGDWGKVNINLRYRLEHVDQDGRKATTGDPVRLRLGYLTPLLSGFRGFVEYEGNAPIFADDYNDLSNEKTEYAVIADPQDSELNQWWLSIETLPDTIIKAGRQKILLDNQRFVGAVGWRQMEQTFDSVNLVNTSLAGLSIDATYIWNVRTITSRNVNMQSSLLNMKYAFQDIGSLTGYGYLLDYDDPDDSGPFEYAFSTQTYGLRFDGAVSLFEDMNLTYTAEYARQSDFQDNPSDYGANYYHFIAGMTSPLSKSLVTDISGKLAYEVLGADNGVSFKTPLGTNHGFNGWADLFLTTPPDGLRDIYGILSSTLAGIKLDLIYHDFQADEGNSDYGNEFDAMLTKKFGSHYILQAVYADYNASDYKMDTRKFWLQFTVVF